MRDGWPNLGPVREVLTRPRHPYTDGLMGSTPLASKGMHRLRQIPGSMPRLGALPDGCAFTPRCPKVADKCRQNPTPTLDSCGGQAACWYPIEPEIEAAESAQPGGAGA